MIRAALPPVLGLLLLCTMSAQPGIHVRSDGNVGINKGDPLSTLVIFGYPPTLRLGTSGGSESSIAGMLIFDSDLSAQSDAMSFCGMALSYDKGDEVLQILGSCYDAEPNTLMTISQDGHIGIGTEPDTFMLQIAGSVRTEEVIVETGWADFVFEEQYDLKSLDEVDAFIKQNGHLPDIPPATEVETGGLHVGSISAKLMQKIEELTLYAIAQEQMIDNQTEEIELLKQSLEQLRVEVAALKSDIAGSE